MTRAILVVLSMLFVVTAARAAESVRFAAADGESVFGDVYAAPAAAKATILLFHQAGSNRAEYAPIAPKLQSLGYNALAIDQRVGGELWGHGNQTAAASRAAPGTYFDALPDLVVALAYAKRTWPGTPVIALGSSYSASLVFILAARHPNEIAGLLSFSPGEYFPGMSVRDEAAKIRCPVFVTSAPTPDEVAAAKRLVDAVPGTRKTQFIPEYGVHGAPALRPDSNPRGATDTWAAVAEFLRALPEDTAAGRHSTGASPD